LSAGVVVVREDDVEPRCLDAGQTGFAHRTSTFPSLTGFVGLPRPAGRTCNVIRSDASA
jgi:hypothetical protein